MTTIRVERNGPYHVEGEELSVVDWNGQTYRLPNRRSFALCRCGGSMCKPLCDGTHSRKGFQAGEAAVPDSGTAPAP